MTRIMNKANQLRRLAYRPADTARVCGVSERTFSDWLKSSDAPPPHFRRGGVVLIPRRELERWLTQQAEKAFENRKTWISSFDC